MKKLTTALLAAGLLSIAAPGSAAVLKGEYTFNDSFASSVAGAPSLVPVDPLARNAFETDTVFGNSRRVYHYDGNASPPAQQAGLSLDTTGLVPGNSYSAELVFEFLDGNNAWRRIIDVQNRQSDNGFYVDPSNNLDIFPVSGSSSTFTNNVFHHVVLTNDAGTARGFLDGVAQFTASTTVMNINNADNPGNLMNFFLDNLVAGGQGEFSDGRVALIRLYSGALTDAEVRTLAASPFPAATPEGAVPEPGVLALLVAGLGALGWRRRGSV